MIEEYGFPITGLLFNHAAYNNQAAIYSVLSEVLTTNETIFEIGSGTVQHGIYCCKRQANWRWQPSDIQPKLEVMQHWVNTAHQLGGIKNILHPMVYHADLLFPSVDSAHVFYTANTLHIMHAQTRQHFIQQLTDTMFKGDVFFAYGPFKKNSQFTTDSNAEFNQWLMNEGHGGLVDIEDIAKWSVDRLKLVKVYDMPANNFLLHWVKI